MTRIDEQMLDSIEFGEARGQMRAWRDRQVSPRARAARSHGLHPRVG